MRAVGIVGLKKSGKTAVTALVAEALERKGLAVGIIKFSQHGLDKQNTDTFWLMRPGRVVAGCGADEAAIFWSRPVAAHELAALMDVDVLLVEGGKHCCSWPRILCLKEPGEDVLLHGPVGEGEEILATVGAAPENGMGPHFAIASPETADALAALILEKGSVLEKTAGVPVSREFSGSAAGGHLKPL